MRKRLSFTVLLIPLSFWLCVKPHRLAQTDSYWEWMYRSFATVLDAVMPLKEKIGTHVAYRSHQDYRTNVPEYSFVIGNDARREGYGLNNYLTAHIRLADPDSIFAQLAKLHQSNPKLEASSLQKDIKVKTWRLTEMKCSAIKMQFGKFLQIHIGAPSFDRIPIHPLIHEFHIHGFDATMDLELLNNDHELVKWALETRNALELCTTSTQ